MINTYRICIELQNGPYLVVQEAPVANILRGCTTVKTHPGIHESKLKKCKLCPQNEERGDARYTN